MKKMTNEEDLVYRLRKRAEIRRQIPGRKSVQEGKADRMADLLDEAANEIEKLRNDVEHCWQEAAGEDL
jgi:surfactin synthase thioesterase subunit